ncbi:MAG: FAD:protein FMN transferase, partial [Clostridia bacterium]|nr:FAD:protein FMN transferase [Clostridia bacterium]
DLLLEKLRAYTDSALVAVGGSIGVSGKKNGSPWIIGVRDPFSENPRETVGYLEAENLFVSTSGSYEKYFDSDGTRYHHILDGVTGYPVRNGLVSVTVICSSGALSDALSTAVFAVGEEKGLALCREYDAGVLFIREDGSFRMNEKMQTSFHIGARQ